MIDVYIFCNSTGLEKFTGTNCDQIGPLIETLSSLKVGARQENRLSIWRYTGAVSRWRYVVNKNVEQYGVCKITLWHWKSASVLGFDIPKRTCLCVCFCVEKKEIECQKSLQPSLPFVIQIFAEFLHVEFGLLLIGQKYPLMGLKSKRISYSYRARPILFIYLYNF